MPRIPDFASLGQTPAPQTPLSVARVETQPLEFNVRQGPGEAAIRGGQEITNAGIQMQERIDTLYAQEATTKAQKVAQALKEDPQQGYVNVKGSDALDPKFLEGYTKQFDDSVKSISQTLPNANAQQLFMNHAQVIGLQYTSGLMAHRAGQYEKWADKTENDAIDTARQTASNADTAADRDTALMDLRTQYARKSARTGLPYDRQFRKDADGASAEYYDHLRQMDPVLAMKAFQSDGEQAISDPKVRGVVSRELFVSAAPVLANELANDPELKDIFTNVRKADLGPDTHTGHEIVDTLPDDQKMHVLALARQQLSERNANDKATLMDKLRDMHAMAEQGITAPPSFIPTNQELNETFGDDRGNILYRDMVLGSLSLATSKQSISGMTNEQLYAVEGAIASPNDPESKKLLTSVFKTADRHQKSVMQIVAPDVGPGFANAVVRQRSLIASINSERAIRQADPAGYIVQNNPDVAAKLDHANALEAGPDPMAARRVFEDYAIAVTAQQDRMGMPHAILTGQDAQRVVGQFYGAKDGGQNAAQVIANLQAKYGDKFFPDVFDQVSRKGAIPSAAIVIAASGMDPTSPEAVANASVSSMDIKVLKEGIPTDMSTAVAKAIPNKLEDLRASMSQTPGGMKLFNAFSDQTEKLALFYVKQGMKDNDAVAKAIQMNVTNHWNFVPNVNARSVPFAVPKTQDENSIANGAASALRSVSDLDLKLPRLEGGMNEQQVKDKFYREVAAQGYWVNDAADKGLLLYMNNAVVLDKSNRPVWRSWGALQMGRPTAAIEAGIPMGETGQPPVATPPSGDKPIDLSRPVIQNADGSISTERTITIEEEGKHYLIPTIVNGKQRTEDEAVALWHAGKNPDVGVYDSADSAEKAAVARSKRIGTMRHGA